MGGAVKTEIMQGSLNDKESHIHNWPYADVMKSGESPRFSGRCLNEVLKRLSNSEFMSKVNGKVVLASDISNKFSIKDIDGRVIESADIFTSLGDIMMSRFIQDKTFGDSKA